MVLSDFWNKAIEEVGGDFLVSSHSVMVAIGNVDAFLDWLAKSGKSLLGAEGFKFDGKHLMPLMECIIDYSHGDPAKSIEVHRKIITESPDFQKAHFIEFVFDE